MSWASPRGDEAEPTRPLIVTPELIAAARDATVVRMRLRGVPWRAIGLYLNTPHTTLKDRYERMPAAERHRYERMPFDLFGT